jgi:hypothetical protein
MGARRLVCREETPREIAGRSHTTMKLSTRLTPTCQKAGKNFSNSLAAPLMMKLYQVKMGLTESLSLRQCTINGMWHHKGSRNASHMYRQRDQAMQDAS